ncbi:ATP-binding protein [Nocardia panacis]|uniref:ATP-binding protein n=1 Tax=Nocardia panacis TaxID=2340916 RepID=A0A3A4KDC3_9NOCA|nr:ATP-binding protein [Nocardia panacis]RJO70865.1 ATP-binding protein [Nocardia panacis]
MTTPLAPSEWESANARFLSASLSWIRLLLQRHLAEHAHQTAPQARNEDAGERPSVDAPRSWWRGSAARVADAGNTTRADGVPLDDVSFSGSPRGSGAVSDKEITAAAAEIAAAESVSPEPALVRLAQRLGLSRFERDTLLLCAAVELDPVAGALCARINGDAQRRCPTFGLALAVLPDPAWEVVSPHAGLRYWRLVELTRWAGDGVIGAGLAADERIVNYLKGLNHLDDRLTPLLTHLDPPSGTLPPSQWRVVETGAEHWRCEVAPVLQLAGPDPAAKRAIAACAAAECGLAAYQLPAAMLPQSAVDLDGLARLWDRESALLPLALYVDAEAVDETGPEPPSLGRFLSRLAGRCVLATRESWSDLGRPSVVLDAAAPTPAERARVWRESLLPTADPVAIDALAAQFAVEEAEIRAVAEMAGGRAEAAWPACRGRTRPRMDALAQRLEPRIDWDDIVLPDPVLRLLHQVADQVEHRTMVYEQWGFGARISRGLGVSVLFAGPSGTGKTMAAEVLAAQLKLDLYRIDLSAVVSKYIGETEKNLRRLFDAAEGGGCILFFDEADSLYGTRSQVKDAHDRYANIEINYLLQRMETYRGLAILATNLRSALDPAFLRRLRFIVEFPFPSPAERKTIWRKSFPAAAPTEDLDFERLAAMSVSGGMARNIAVNAAFLAAADGARIGMRHALAAARSEFEKLELPVRDRDFAVDEVGAP